MRSRCIRARTHVVPAPPRLRTGRIAAHEPCDNANENVGEEQEMGSTSVLPQPPNKKVCKSKLARSRRNVRTTPIPFDLTPQPAWRSSHIRKLLDDDVEFDSAAGDFAPTSISSVAPILFVEPGQTVFDGIGLPTFNQPAFDGLGEPSLGGFGQPAFGGLGQAALDAYGQSPVEAFDLSAFIGFISCAPDMPS